MRNRFKNIGALLIGFLFAIAILEVFFSLYNPFGFRQKGDKIVLPSDYKITYDNRTIEGLDSIIIHTKNSLGFRGLEIPKDTNNWLSIISVGGSTTECFYISDEKDWGCVVRKKIK